MAKRRNEGADFSVESASVAWRGLLIIVSCRRATFIGWVLLILLPLRCPQITHASQIQRQAHELELGLHPVQAAKAELTEPQHALDPVVWRR